MTKKQIPKLAISPMTENIYIATKYEVEDIEEDVILAEEKYDITEYFYKLVKDKWELNLKDTRGFYDVLFDKIKDFGPIDDHPTYWGAAIAGEAGEVANLLKKLERDGLKKTVDKITGMQHKEEHYGPTQWDRQIFGEKLGEELADVMIYCILIARKFPDVDLKTALRDKLIEVDRRIKTEEVIKATTWKCDIVDCDNETTIKGSLCADCSNKYVEVDGGPEQ